MDDLVEKLKKVIKEEDYSPEDAQIEDSGLTSQKKKEFLEFIIYRSTTDSEFRRLFELIEWKNADDVLIAQLEESIKNFSDEETDKRYDTIIENLSDEDWFEEARSRFFEEG